MMLADALSHYHSQPAPEIELDITINCVQLFTEYKTAMQNATAADQELPTPVQMIIGG